ncbi:MPPV-024 ankyrin repeat protein [Magpiepox virus 2]|nr:MPPV-024 ankyrin repeat protein [Magpiepox virus 2]
MGRLYLHDLIYLEKRINTIMNGNLELTKPLLYEGADKDLYTMILIYYLNYLYCIKT